MLTTKQMSDPQRIPSKGHWVQTDYGDVWRPTSYDWRIRTRPYTHPSQDSEEYKSFLEGVMKAFNSVPDSEKHEKKSIDFFMPFVQHRFTRERAIVMMLILACDKRLQYDEELNEAKLNEKKLNEKKLNEKKLNEKKLTAAVGCLIN